MLYINDIVARCIAIKEKHGFPMNDPSNELSRAYDELMEAIEAWKFKTPEEFGDELADVFIFIACAAKFANIDLEKSIKDKVERNEKREWSKKT